MENVRNVKFTHIVLKMEKAVFKKNANKIGSWPKTDIAITVSHTLTLLTWFKSYAYKKYVNLGKFLLKMEVVRIAQNIRERNKL